MSSQQGAGLPIRSRPADPNSPNCPGCARSFNDLGALWAHQIQSHPDVYRPYSCEHCNTTFQRSDMLQRHAGSCAGRRTEVVPFEGPQTKEDEYDSIGVNPWLFGKKRPAIRFEDEYCYHSAPEYASTVPDRLGPFDTSIVDEKERNTSRRSEGAIRTHQFRFGRALLDLANAAMTANNGAAKVQWQDVADDSLLGRIASAGARMEAMLEDRTQRVDWTVTTNVIPELHRAVNMLEFRAKLKPTMRKLLTLCFDKLKVFSANAHRFGYSTLFSLITALIKRSESNDSSSDDFDDAVKLLCSMVNAYGGLTKATSTVATGQSDSEEDAEGETDEEDAGDRHKTKTTGSANKLETSFAHFNGAGNFVPRSTTDKTLAADPMGNQYFDKDAASKSPPRPTADDVAENLDAMVIDGSTEYVVEPAAPTVPPFPGSNYQARQAASGLQPHSELNWDLGVPPKVIDDVMPDAIDPKSTLYNPWPAGSTPPSVPRQLVQSAVQAPHPSHDLAPAEMLICWNPSQTQQNPQSSQAQQIVVGSTQPTTAFAMGQLPAGMTFAEQPGNVMLANLLSTSEDAKAFKKQIRLLRDPSGPPMAYANPDLNEPFSCEVCFVSFPSYEKAAEHVHVHHITPPSIHCQCPLCLVGTQSIHSDKAAVLEFLRANWAAIKAQRTYNQLTFGYPHAFGEKGITNAYLAPGVHGMTYGEWCSWTIHPAGLPLSRDSTFTPGEVEEYCQRTGIQPPVGPVDVMQSHGILQG